MTKIGTSVRTFLLWLELGRGGFYGLAYMRVSGARVWGPAEVEWLQCRSHDVAGLYRVLP
jgi:hypothetical protein